ncbi:MAG: NAD(P)H-dependent oxidoreductase subunit E [Deltaproteobacteria bacterium]|nr:NAD(P)H-dependent oxidoreductase subunit E [Deltaproteobacteria bacterium]MBI3296033.1 NAD(P)H-dependent oxidoreductase subunit E [Deltaproteobacteria bacterium]
MKYEFTPERMKEFQKVKAKYERPRSALLPALYLAQEQWKFLSDEAIQYVAGLLEMPAREVFEAVSFYTMFRKKDMGKYCLQVCNNITCTLMGSEALLDLLHKELDVGLSETTKDGMFSILSVQCLGSCGTAPVVQINENYYENMNCDRLKITLQQLRGTT